MLCPKADPEIRIWVQADFFFLVPGCMVKETGSEIGKG